MPEVSFPGLQSDITPTPDCGETTYTGSGRLAGRRALITGGDSGIGRAIAIAFAREGADVVINYLPEEESDAAEVVSVVQETTDSQIFTLPGDLRSESFCEELVHESAELMGGLDILISNAAFTRGAPNITSITTENFVRTMETNIYAPFFLTRAAIPILPPGSNIIYTSSQIFENPPYWNADYAASKAWTSTWAYALQAGLLQESGIKVNVLRPALTLTNLLSTQGITTEQAQQSGATRPIGRIMQPVEIAPLWVDVVVSNSSFVAGRL